LQYASLDILLYFLFSVLIAMLIVHCCHPDRQIYY
jgi:hypothetical protein